MFHAVLDVPADQQSSPAESATGSGEHQPPDTLTAETQALIEEARRRARRRRTGLALVALAAAASLLAVGMAVGGGSSGNGGGGSGSGRAPARPHGSPGASARAQTTARPPVPLYPRPSYISAMGLVAPGAGYAVNGLHIYFTSDDGEHWRILQPPHLTGGDMVANLSAVATVGRRTLFLADSGAHGYGVCGHPSGSRLPDGTLAAEYAIGFVDATSDAGRSWRAGILPDCAYAVSLSFTSARTGYALGLTYGGASALYETTNAGHSWVRVSRTPFEGSIELTAAGVGFGLSNQGDSPREHAGRLYRTTDGGRTWQPVGICSGAAGTAVPGTRSICGAPYQFGARDAVAPVAVVRTTARFHGTVLAETPLIYRTSDGGRSWSVSRLPAGSNASFGLMLPGFDGNARLQLPFAATSPTHWTFLAGNRIYTTNDAGRRWSSVIPQPAFEPPWATDDDAPLKFASPADGWLVGTLAASGASGPGQIFERTTNGGRTWAPL